MRIISKFHDYYDSGSQFGVDPLITFVRESNEITSQEDYPFHSMGHLIGYNNTILGNSNNQKADEKYCVVPGLVFFCGEIYPFVKYVNYMKTVQYKTGYSYDGGYTNPEHCAYTFDELKDHLGDMSEKFKECFKRWFTDQKVPKCDYFTVHAMEKYNKITSMDSVSVKKMFYDYALKNNITYFSVSAKDDGSRRSGVNVVSHHPCLKNFEFFKVMPIFNAWQKIQMFITNDLAREKKMTIKPISDKLKAESHGFNKYSFRKEKEVV